MRDFMRRGPLIMATIYGTEAVGFVAGLSIGLHFRLGPVWSGVLGAGIVVVLAVPATIVAVRTRSRSDHPNDDSG